MRTLRPAALVGATAAVVLIVIIAGWLAVSRQDVGRSDFTSTYVGATLLRQGHGDRLYDENLQAPLHASLIAPDREGNLPFVNPPAAAVAALPLSWLGLDSAYRLFGLLQLALLGLAVAIAARAAPWPAATPRGVIVAACVVALAGTGTVNLLLLGQWDGTCALGLALAYANLRRGRSARGGAWLAAGAAFAKPHLAIGLATYALGRRDRRLLLGAAAAVAALAGVALAAAGPAGTAGFARAALDSTGRWPLRSMLGFSGLFGSWLGDTATAHALAAAGTAGAALACGVLGAAVRRSPRLLEPALAGAAALSLLASPHLLGHDLVLLAPALVWCLAWAAQADHRVAWPGPAGLRVIGLWLVVTLAARVDLGNDAPAPPGRLVPWALLAVGCAALAVCGLRRTQGARTAAAAVAQGGGR